jgi:NAD/NADP transhydrogenase alpha subunit
MRTTAARTLSPVLALVAALALVAVAILTGALTSAGHDSAGASWNKKDHQAGASWNKKDTRAGASWNYVGGR